MNIDFKQIEDAFLECFGERHVIIAENGPYTTYSASQLQCLCQLDRDQTHRTLLLLYLKAIELGVPASVIDDGKPDLAFKIAEKHVPQEHMCDISDYNIAKRYLVATGRADEVKGYEEWHSENYGRFPVRQYTNNY